MHLLSGDVDPPAARALRETDVEHADARESLSAESSGHSGGGANDDARIARLESELEALKSEMAELRQQLAQFRRQFE